jgi:hypothetical protein
VSSLSIMNGVTPALPPPSHACACACTCCCIMSLQAPPTEGVVHDAALLALLQHNVDFAIASYDLGKKRVNVALDSVIYHQPRSSALKPAYLIVDDTAARQIVLSIRGTHAFSDVVTDAAAVPIRFFGNRCDVCERGQAFGCM